jgi:hypothetical protein
VTTDNLLLSDTHHDESTACQVNTHASTTDPDAWLFRKGRGKEAKLCHMA